MLQGKEFAFMDEDRKALILYRLDKSKDCIETAELVLEHDHYADCANRSYYAIFHAVRALLAIEGVDRKKHSAVIAYFQEHYVKTGIFDKTYSKIIQQAFNIRQISDYQDFFVFSYDDVIEQLENAKKFYNKMNEYIMSKL